jgi:nicotinamidase-related amidase
MPESALIVVDVQRAFQDAYRNPTTPRNNPACEENVAALIDAFRRRGDALVYVRHDSVGEDSPLRPDHPGNAFQDVVSGEPDLLVTKQVNSAFLGDPPLEPWLRERGIGRIAVCGIQTNMCCETTARMGGNLGFDVDFVLDATHTFDLPAYGGGTIPADDLARVTASNLDGEFATVRATRELL